MGYVWNVDYEQESCWLLTLCGSQCRFLFTEGALELDEMQEDTLIFFTAVWHHNHSSHSLDSPHSPHSSHSSEAEDPDGILIDWAFVANGVGLREVLSKTNKVSPPRKNCKRCEALGFKKAKSLNDAVLI